MQGKEPPEQYPVAFTWKLPWTGLGLTQVSLSYNCRPQSTSTLAQRAR